MRYNISMDLWISIFAATSKSNSPLDWLGFIFLILFFTPVGWVIFGLLLEAFDNSKTKKAGSNTTNVNTYNATASTYKTPSTTRISTTSPAKPTVQPFANNSSFSSNQLKKTTGLKSEVTSLDDINLGDEQKRVFRMMNSTKIRSASILCQAYIKASCRRSTYRSCGIECRGTDNPFFL